MTCRYFYYLTDQTTPGRFWFIKALYEFDEARIDFDNNQPWLYNGHIVIRIRFQDVDAVAKHLEENGINLCGVLFEDWEPRGYQSPYDHFKSHCLQLPSLGNVLDD